LTYARGNYFLLGCTSTMAIRNLYFTLFYCRIYTRLKN